MGVNLRKKREVKHQLQNAISGGNYERVIWLIEKALQLGTQVEITNIMFKSCFRKYVDMKYKESYLKIAQYLWHKSIELNIYIDIHDDNEFAFRSALYHAELEKAQWLWNLGKELNSPINIRIEQDSAFLYNCFERYMFKNKIICKEPDYDFDRHLNVVVWLCSICSEYNYEIYEEKNIRYKINDEYADPPKVILMS
jgi:hypothetical protein